MTDRPAHRAAATVIRWATQSRDNVGSGVYGYCHGAGTTAQPSRPAEGAPDHCRTQALWIILAGGQQVPGLNATGTYLLRCTQWAYFIDE